MIPEINIVELIKLVYQALTDSKTKVRRWRPIFKLYEDLVSIISASNRLLEGPLKYESSYYTNDGGRLNTLRSIDRLKAWGQIEDEMIFKLYGHALNPIEYWAGKVNSNFHEVDSSIRTFLETFKELSFTLEIENSELRKKLRFHFWYKSIWLQIFQDVLESGVVSRDGKKITGKYLKVLQKIDIVETWEREDTYKKLKEDLLVIIEEDIGSQEKKNKLLEAGKQNLEKLEECATDLRNLIKSNCTIDELLKR